MGRHHRTRSEKTEHGVDCPFFIFYLKAIPKIRKEKRKGSNTGQGIKCQGFSLPINCLDLLYVVGPDNAWQKLTSYKSFVFGGLKFKRGDFVSVANETTIRGPNIIDKSYENERINDQDWVARILEIRASDANHVYARIQWMYRPYELPSSTDRRGQIQDTPYYEKKELILSNHLDIIDVFSVSGQAEVYQQAQADHGESKIEYFWRYAYDWRHCRLYRFDSTHEGDRKL